MRKKAAASKSKSSTAKPSTPTDFGTYLTTAEAAQYLKLSKPFLEGARYRADGSGPRFIKLEKSVRYKRSALDAYMDAHDHAPDQPL